MSKRSRIDENGAYAVSSAGDRSPALGAADGELHSLGVMLIGADSDAALEILLLHKRAAEIGPDYLGAALIGADFVKTQEIFLHRRGGEITPDYLGAALADADVATAQLILSQPAARDISADDINMALRDEGSAKAQLILSHWRTEISRREAGSPAASVSSARSSASSSPMTQASPFLIDDEPNLPRRPAPLRKAKASTKKQTVTVLKDTVILYDPNRHNGLETETMTWLTFNRILTPSKGQKRSRSLPELQLSPDHAPTFWQPARRHPSDQFTDRTPSPSSPVRNFTKQLSYTGSMVLSHRRNEESDVHSPQESSSPSSGSRSSSLSPDSFSSIEEPSLSPSPANVSGKQFTVLKKTATPYDASPPEGQPTGQSLAERERPPSTAASFRARIADSRAETLYR